MPWIPPRSTPRRTPQRSCSVPGCGNLIAAKGSRCDRCRAAFFKQRDARRLSPSKRGYDDTHRRLRVLCFERDGWRCVDCGWEPDIVRESKLYGLDDPPTEAILHELLQRHRRKDRHLHGDHDIPIEQRPDLRTDIDNYKTRCNECHSAKTMRELLAMQQ